MPRSMTAFARTVSEFDWGSICCELRSVNHRFLDINFRMPETLRELEGQLRDSARKKLNRGKIDCAIKITLTDNANSAAIDRDLAKQYIELAEDIAAQITNPAPISALDIMNWPGILKNQEVNAEVLHRATSASFDLALEQLFEGRHREGEKLAEMIEQRLQGIETEVSKVRQHLPTILANQRQRLSAKLVELKSQLDSERLEQEMVLIANRSDVDEELDRLDAHISEIRRVLKSTESIGRRLDFLMQELNREANTLGSKSLANVTTQASVELKVLIEQMREQIQNIE
jgi:uncharacterized protein (TIGR00255 family)